jgi:hypothetical protein
MRKRARETDNRSIYTFRKIEKKQTTILLGTIRPTPMFSDFLQGQAVSIVIYLL